MRLALAIAVGIHAALFGVSALVDVNRLWGRGLSAVDAHLLAALRLRPSGRLWTRDKKLRSAARQLGIDVVAT